MSKKEVLFDFMILMREETDENHPLTAQMIIKRIKEKKGVTITRQTIYSYITLLEKYDFEILLKGTHEGFYLSERQLEAEEIEWLCHSVMSNNTLPINYSINLMNKLLGTQSNLFKKKLEHRLHIVNPDKKENKEVFLSIREISEAIDERVTIQFKYARYNINKEIVIKHDKFYEVEPLCTVVKDNKMYLVANGIQDDGIRHYRLDRLVGVSKTVRAAKHRNIDAYDYTRSRLYMYAGELDSFELLCQNNVLDDVIELFGLDITLKEVNNNQFSAIVKTTEAAMLYFAFQFIRYVEVISPASIRERILEEIEIAKHKYQVKN